MCSVKHCILLNKEATECRIACFPGNGKRGGPPVQSAIDTSDKRDAMIGRIITDDAGGLTSFGTPTQSRYNPRLPQQQQPDDQLPPHVSSVNSDTDARLNSQWSQRRRQPLWLRLLVGCATLSL